MVRKCDMCDVALDATTPGGSDTRVVIDGEPVIVYDDLCDACKARFARNAEKYLGTVKRQHRTEKEG